MWRGKKAYRSHDCRLPLEHIVTSRSSRAGRWGITSEIDQFLESKTLTSCRAKRRYHCGELVTLGLGGNASHSELKGETTFNGREQTLLMRLRAIGTVIC